MKKKEFFLLLMVAISLTYFSCKHHPKDSPDGPPTELNYSPDAVQITAGDSFVSVVPTILGIGPITYSLVSAPYSNGSLTIDGKGAIHADVNLISGVYLINVTATNPGGATLFKNAFTLTVNEPISAPTSIQYSEDTLRIDAGTSASSSVPTVTGTHPIKFSMTSSPSRGKHIGINDSTGQLVVDSTLAVGVYTVSVTATNAIGSLTRDLIVKVSPLLPFNLVYTPNSLTLLAGLVQSSALPSVQGTRPMTYQLTSNPSTNQIIIDAATGKITTEAGLAEGVYTLSVMVTNAAGSVQFDNAYTITANPNVHPPSQLVYTTNHLTVTSGQTGVSIAPTVNGTTPTFSITSSPSSGGNISIDPLTGVITTSPSLGVGTYTLTVTATNSSGTTSTTFTVVVSSVNAPSSLLYTPASYYVVIGSAGVSALPSIVSSEPVTYSITSSPANAAISIDHQTGVISSTGLLPVGTYSLAVTATNSGGSKVFTNAYTITVNAIVPSALVYTPNSLTVNQGSMATSVAPTVSGTEPMTYSFVVSPSNANVTINSSTGILSTTPSLPVGTYTATVSATNPAGSTTATFTIHVVAVAATNLVYSPNSSTITHGATVTSVVPTVSGTLPITYSLATTPSTTALSINTSTGVISSTAALAVGTYSIDVTASNAAGAPVFTNAYSITVTSTSVAPSALTYSSNSITEFQGTAGTSVAPSVVGTTPITYTLVSNPANAGITIHAQTGVITSSSTVPTGIYHLTVTATNSVGTTTATFTVNVNAASPPSALSYSPSSFTVTQGASDSSVVPTITSVEAVTYSLVSSPSNSAIQINPKTGVISSNSSLSTGTYSITVTASNTAGTTSASYSVTVNAIPPSNLIYSPNTLSVNQGAIGTSVSPTVTGSTPITYSLVSTPSNANITINSATGVITSSASVSSGTYAITVTGTNSSGSTTASFTITIQAVAPSGLTYSANSLTLAQGVAGTSVAPTVNGTTPITYTLSSNPSNANITINPSTGVISASASLPGGTYALTVTATNASGFTTASYSITVSALAPTSLVYTPNTLSLNQGTAGASVAPTVSGTTPITYSLTVSPASSFISINSTTGILSSTASTPAGTYAISVTATNSAGSKLFSNVYTITVNSAGPSGLTYSPTTLKLTHGVAGTSSTPTVTGAGPITYSFTSSPSSSAITINTSTGVLSASTSLAAGTYAITVKATNSSGSTTATYTITINPSYALDIASIMTQYCTSCHKSGGNSPNLTTMSGTSSNISRVISDIQRNSMPPSGSRPTAAQLTLLQNWQSSGMAP